MKPPVVTPGRIAILLIPVVGFFATPFLPFTTHPTLWLGLPAALIWSALMVVLTVVCLQIVDSMYLARGGRERDREERELLDENALAALRAERIASEKEEGIH